MKLKKYTPAKRQFCPALRGSLFGGRGLALCVLGVLLLLSARALACGPDPIVVPDDCDLYRILPYYAELQEPDYGRREANCLAWQRTLGGRIPEASIRQAIYDFTLRDWLLVQQGDARGNAFCQHLLDTRDTDAVRLLVWSKYYEDWSEQMRSPWYYSCGMDQADGIDVDTIAAVAAAYRGRYEDRYVLLAMKCLYRSDRNEECDALWQKRKGALRGSHLSDQAEGYRAACLNRMGHKREAIDIYSRIGDAASLFLLVPDRVEVFERVLRNRPNSPFFPVALQRVLFVAENYVTGNEMTLYDLDSVQLRRLAEIARLAGNDSRVRDHALWRYTAACLHDHLGEPRKALSLVANLSSKDDFLNTSIRVLRMRLHARLDPINDAYEQRLLAELRWLDGRMQQEWAAADSATRFRLSHIDGFGYNYSVYRTVYANDALRRIVLAKDGLYDRFRRAGRTTRALQLANMADNRFLQISQNPIVALCRAGESEQELYCSDIEDAPSYNAYYSWFPVYLTDTTGFTNPFSRMVHYNPLRDFEGEDTRRGSYFNAHDFSNILFIRADRLGADALAEYYRRVEKPTDATDRWLNERGYTDADYWRDIIGTHCLREMRFAEAYDWLRQVGDGYADRLNTTPWMQYDPLEYDAVAITPADRHGYKLRFAMVMGHQETYMQEKPDPNDRADAMLQLSIGLRNAFSNRAWPLVAYGYSGFYTYGDDYDAPLWEDEWLGWYCPYMIADDAAVPYAEAAEKRAANLRHQAFATYTDPDRKAQALRRVREFTYLMHHYANTPTGQDIARHCDQWKDYRRR
ncbi:MAG: hypothetical protein IJ634_06535 [Bacteroidales bacterium]|nr:hypothetical protein [Bacteroidales bacterium]